MNSVEGSYHAILLQAAEKSHFHEFAEIVSVTFHTFQGADQFIVFHKNTFEPGCVKTEGVMQGTSKQDSLLPEVLDGEVDVQEDAQARKMHVHTRVCSPKQHDREEARNCKHASGPVQGSCRSARR